MHQPRNFLLVCSVCFFITSTTGLMHTLINHFDYFVVNCISATVSSLLMNTCNEDKHVFFWWNCIITT